MREVYSYGRSERSAGTESLRDDSADSGGQLFVFRDASIASDRYSGGSRYAIVIRHDFIDGECVPCVSIDLLEQSSAASRPFPPGLHRSGA
jgi:hypothetical protein